MALSYAIHHIESHGLARLTNYGEYLEKHPPEQQVEIIHLRGHTPGSVAVLLRAGDEGDHLFTGDSLFPGGVGNTQQDPQRFASLIDDVERRLFDYLPDDTAVHPGHGKGTTLGAERPHLAEWRERGW